MALCGPVVSNVSTICANTLIAKAPPRGKRRSLATNVLVGPEVVRRRRLASVTHTIRRAAESVKCVRVLGGAAYPVGGNETAVDLRHRATLGRSEFGCHRDGICEVRLRRIIV
jgi:hypothetical protein